MTILEMPHTAPVPYPVPVGRGRWRLTLHRRAFAASTWQSTIVTELSHARGRRLEQAWNTPAMLTFSIDGERPEAALVQELGTEVIAWRWDDYTGQDIIMFRGLVDHSEDQVTETTSVVTFTCHDYLAMLQRRLITTTYTATQRDQDTIAADLLNAAVNAASSSGQSFTPGSYLPLVVQRTTPDGSARAALSGQLRDRTYAGSQVIGEALDNLANVINGFEYDVLCAPPQTNYTYDQLRIFYNAATPAGPHQGVVRSDVALIYGANVSGFTRTVSSEGYANYVRVLGNSGSADPAAPQLFAEAWNSDSNNVTVNPVGLWATADNAADVSIQSTLNAQAQGDLNLDGVLIPSYTLTLTPGRYRRRYPNMGDTVPLVLQVSRLNVNTSVRVLGINYGISDDEDETVELVVGRSPTTLANLFTQTDRDVDALVRR